MSNNHFIQVIRKPGTGPSEPSPQIHSDKPSIVHELDRQILKILEKEGALTRSKLVSLTGIARSTLYDSLLRLMLKGYIASFSEDRRHRGRPKVFYKVLD
ncbi:MAG: winged helix-turn-helix transcriptional regulator [Candidatus Hodarchaeales archaeon]|jgi:predicted ArsR family transcriptional regulator